jgi:hypothetical protein
MGYTPPPCWFRPDSRGRGGAGGSVWGARYLRVVFRLSFRRWRRLGGGVWVYAASVWLWGSVVCCGRWWRWCAGRTLPPRRRSASFEVQEAVFGRSPPPFRSRRCLWAVTWHGMRRGWVCLPLVSGPLLLLLVSLLRLRPSPACVVVIFHSSRPLSALLAFTVIRPLLLAFVGRGLIGL